MLAQIILLIACVDRLNGFKDLSCSFMVKSNFNCVSASKYRSFDGKCNNLDMPWSGIPNLPYKRVATSDYDDPTSSSPRKTCQASNGATLTLPNPRTISLAIGNDTGIALNKRISHFLAMFGQFVSHDITGFKTVKNANCTCQSTNPNCTNIVIPTNDPILTQKCEKMTRSADARGELNCKNKDPSRPTLPRQQINSLNAYLDLSTVYGMPDTQRSLRTLSNGEMKTSNFKINQKDVTYLPVDEENFFVAGEGRNDENMGLASIHVMFLREHNRLAQELRKQIKKTGSDADYDELIYQEARRINIAEYQEIIYSEYVPAVVGRMIASDFGILPEPVGSDRYFDRYNPNLDVSILNEFAAAAGRFGHSLVRHMFVSFDSNWQTISTPIRLSQLVFNTDPAFNSSNQGLEGIGRGLVGDRASSFDTGFAWDLQNNLFTSEEPDGTFHSTDLLATNIQRGRDHGFSSYVETRRQLGLRPDIHRFEDLRQIMSDDKISQLKAIYSDVNCIDLYAGGLSELPLSDGIVGPTFAAIIARQFDELKRGDRYYYENSPSTSPGAFTKPQLNQIRKQTLAGLMARNIPMTSIQPKAFFCPYAESATRKRRQAQPLPPNHPPVELDGLNEKPRNGGQQDRPNRPRPPPPRPQDNTNFENDPSNKRVPVSNLPDLDLSYWKN